VAYGEERLREAAKVGFARAVIPRANAPKQPIEGLAITLADNLRDIMRLLPALEA
jgi:DNA repair protein RadA/Sms